MKKQYQQGDVCMQQISSLPKGNAKSVTPNKGRLILAEGEATGHAHAVAELDGVDLLEIDGSLYFQTDNKVDIQHEEHKTITVDPGIYEIGTVNEYDYFGRMHRKVKD
jgi:hypothetical protein